MASDRNRYKRNLLVSLLIILSFSVFAFAANRAGVYIDVTENRRNSFNPADEAALRGMRSPLLLRIYLSPDDSRLKEMEANFLGNSAAQFPILKSVTKIRLSMAFSVPCPMSVTALLFLNTEEIGPRAAQ